jgi:dUTPase
MQSQPLTINVKVEKTGKAYVLEKKLDISWDIARHFDFDAGYDVRAAIYEPLTIFSRKFEVIPIGLKFEIQDPYCVRPVPQVSFTYGQVEETIRGGFGSSGVS